MTAVSDRQTVATLPEALPLDAPVEQFKTFAFRVASGDQLFPSQCWGEEVTVYPQVHSETGPTSRAMSVLTVFPEGNTRGWDLRSNGYVTVPHTLEALSRTAWWVRWDHVADAMPYEAQPAPPSPQGDLPVAPTNRVLQEASLPSRLEPFQMNFIGIRTRVVPTMLCASGDNSLTQGEIDANPDRVWTLNAVDTVDPNRTFSLTSTEGMYRWVHDIAAWSPPLDESEPQSTTEAEQARHAEERASRVVELTTDVERLTGEVNRLNALLTQRGSNLDEARATHARDLEIISAALLHEAEERDWCGEYDEVIEKINRKITGDLKVREQEVSVTVSGWIRVPFSHTVTVTVGPDDDRDDVADSYVRDNLAASSIVRDDDYIDRYSAEFEDDFEFEVN